MKLNMQIHKIKSIDSLEIELPITKGIYAITGQNGAGKSTIVACASSVFFNMPMKEYFGDTESDSFIKFKLDGATREWVKDGKVWQQHSSGNMNVRGFFEGSLIFGYRFRDTSYDKLRKLARIDHDKLIPADEFIRKNLGLILQGDENFYEKLMLVSGKYETFDGTIFFYEKNSRRVSQFHMSTGENLLLSILNSLYLKRISRNKEKSNNSRNIIFLDEIELALHPSSLKRLVDFLKEFADEYNYAVYFSTHSIELISGIKPDNIFYVDRHVDNTLEVLNPCYPAYATKFLYDQSGYDNVILVEDDLAKEIIKRIIRNESMMDNKLVHVLPCGGHNNVMELANDVVSNNLLGKKASICVILDLDIKVQAEQYKKTHNICNNIPVQYLPIESLERYLRTQLYVNVDHALFRRLENYLFQQVSLKDIISKYKTSPECRAETDFNGKRLYNLIDTELRSRKKDRAELIEEVVSYLFNTNNSNLTKITQFLKKQLESGC